MKRNVNMTLLAGTLILAAMSLLLSACSMDSSPVSAPVAEEAQHFQYPVFDPATLGNELIPGYKALETGRANALDDQSCDTVLAERFCNDNRNTTVRIQHLVEVRITRGDLASDETISILAPRSCYAVADFYPHPYQFRGQVEIIWKIRDLNLPRDFDYNSLIPFYVTDSGEYLPMPYEWRNGHDEMIVYTNHFSRYILGSPATSSME